MKYLSILILMLLTWALQGQVMSKQVVSNAGSSYSTDEITMTWTTGESIVGTLQSPGANVVITQGFHQNHLIVTSVGEEEFDFKISVFPNPTNEFILVNTEQKLKNLQVFNQNGKLVRSINPISNQVRIDFDAFPIGVYYLKVRDETKMSVTKKIVKQ